MSFIGRFLYCVLVLDHTIRTYVHMYVHVYVHFVNSSIYIYVCMYI